MVSTRSKTAQTHLEDLTKESSTPTKRGRSSTTEKSSPKANTSKRRKSAEAVETEQSSAKHTKSTKCAKTEKVTNDESKIIINRAPVLQLWTACVAHAIHPELSWDNCLSTGSAVSTICAVAKGRSIGTVPEKDESEEKQIKRDKAKKAAKSLEYIQVIQFKLRLKDGLALVGSEGMGKPSGEEVLKKKFGEGEYNKTKEAFEEALKSGRIDGEGLNENAFGFYEKFRPEVRGGQKGWGRKGELDLGKVSKIITK